MLTGAYWISPQGKVLDVGISKHIDHIVQHPESFGLTDAEVEAVYAKHNEQVGVEGQAREELILQTVSRGYIRIRFYVNKRWSITLSNINSRTNKNILQKWAQLPDVQKDIHMPVFILDIATEKTNTSYTVKDLAQGIHLTENEKINIELIVVNSAREFDIPTFKDFVTC